MKKPFPLQAPGDCLLFDSAGNVWLRYQSPLSIVATRSISEVKPSLELIENAVEERSLDAVGYVAYEAGAAFDEAFPKRAAGNMPLLWFGLYNEPAAIGIEKAFLVPGPRPHWIPSTTFDDYDTAIASIKDALAAGETYQVNYTFPFHAAWHGDPLDFFLSIAGIDPSPYACYLDIGSHVLASFSPELFFEISGDRLLSRPMKGTSRRGRTAGEDAALSARLRASEKERAENVMIVDMIRNDLGRIARSGSVAVNRLFEVERFPTVLQMTSTVSCRTDASITGIMEALFPCASVTGAPKANTMAIIDRLEKVPRGVYTGAIGRIRPHRRALFSVAIRTAVIDKERKSADYGVGGGILADSSASSEYEECLIKTRVLAASTYGFSLLETILWTPAAGFFLPELHVGRLLDSCRYFGFRCDETSIRDYCAAIAAALTHPSVLRFLVDRDGQMTHEIREPARAAGPLTLAVAGEPVDSTDPFLFHKTTNRVVYDAARQAAAGADDVILWNERQEVTETTIGNIVVELGGRLVTPHADSGLLKGVFRDHLLRRNIITETLLRLDDLRRCRRLFRINSVRKWQECIVRKQGIESAGK